MKKDIKLKIKLIIVNIFTIIRLIGALILPIVYFKNGPSNCAIVTLLLFITDFIDGLLARILKCSTLFGAGLDAVSDKILNIISFLLLGFTYKVMIYPLILELLIIYSSYMIFKYGGNVQTLKVGKIKTLILNICVILCFVLLGMNIISIDNNTYNFFINNTNFIINFLSSITTIFSLITLASYTNKFKYTKKEAKFKKIRDSKKKLKSKDQLFKIAFDIEYYKKHKDESLMDMLYV